MNASAYAEFIAQLTNNLLADARVLGLVLAGSTANQSHAPDKWSDHDFFVITAPGVQEKFRQNLDWLPDSASIVLSVRETEHGLKVLYASGHLLEFAIFDQDEIGRAQVNDYKVVFDRGGVTEAVRRIASSKSLTGESPETRQRNMGMFLSLLIVGAGRVARGEAISGQVFIRTYAVSHLLQALVQGLPATDHDVLDNLDPFRRFEQAIPEIGAQINDALSHDPITAATALLGVFEQNLREVEGYPATAATTVRQFIQRFSP